MPRGDVKTMETKVSISDEETISVSSVFVESVKGWVRPTDYNNRFNVTITCGGTSETFQYHISIDETNKGKKVLTDEDHISALYSFIGDAIAGTMGFEEFMDEYGYTNCREGYRIHKACKKAMDQYNTLNIGDAYEVSNFIQKKYPDVV